MDFCAKSKYCLELKYHRQGAKVNKVKLTLKITFPKRGVPAL